MSRLWTLAWTRPVLARETTQLSTHTCFFEYSSSSVHVPTSCRHVLVGWDEIQFMSSSFRSDNFLFISETVLSVAPTDLTAATCGHSPPFLLLFTPLLWYFLPALHLAHKHLNTFVTNVLFFFFILLLIWFIAVSHWSVGSLHLYLTFMKCFASSIRLKVGICRWIMI